MWTATIEGRIASKKNSKRILRNRHSGRIIVASSSAYSKWHEYASVQLLTKRPKQPITTPVSLICDFQMKGKLDSDLDNAMASIADLLQDIGVLANDKQIMEAHLSKSHGHKDFSTTITVIPL